MADNYQEHTLQDDINRLHIALDDLKTEWGAAVLSLDEENVAGVARAMLAAEHAAFMALHPELKELQFGEQTAYFKGLKVCALAALQHLRQQAGLGD